MELPPYKRPLLRVVVRHMWDRSKLFLRRAGTIILGINILLWGLATYPRSSAVEIQFAVRRAALSRTAAPGPRSNEAVQARAKQLNALENEEAGLKLRNSFAGRLGRLIEPAIAPLGFDWKMGIGIIASFAAREVFVSTMSTVYNVGTYDRSEAKKTALEKTLQAQKNPNGPPVYTTLTALTLMVFYVFALQS